MQKGKEHAKRHPRDVISKIQTQGNSTRQMTQFLQEKIMKEKTEKEMDSLQR